MDHTLFAAVWGLVGALPYALMGVATALWGSADIEARAKKLAIAKALIAIVTGPVAAAAVAPSLVERAHGLSLAGVSALAGALANATWPLLSDPKIAKRALAAVLKKIGGGADAVATALEDKPDDA